MVSQEALVQVTDVDAAVHVVALDVVQDLEQVHMGRRATVAAVVVMSVELIRVAAVLLHDCGQLLLVVVATESSMARGRVLAVSAPAPAA